ncbi:MAG: hypothetical protein HYZ28_10150 [Myxococcales bacterium]|nr:hypothetical protein [Myxococcales bacterium]
MKLGSGGNRRWAGKGPVVALLAGLVIGLSVGAPMQHGCGGELAEPGWAPEEAGSSAQELTASNGLSTNGLLSNGLLSNGLLSNGLLSNGLLSNGLLSNGLLSNGLLSNGLLSNGLLSNGLLSNGLLSNGIVSARVLSDGGLSDPLVSMAVLRQLLPNPALPTGAGVDWDRNGTIDSTELINNSAAAQAKAQTNRMFLRYLYQCAKKANSSFFIDLDGSGTGEPAPSGDEFDDQNEMFTGNLGLADEVGTENCGVSCERWVSACLLARVNYLGKKVVVSLRGPNPALANQSATELASYTVPEGAFYGNLFTRKALSDGGSEPDPRLYACAAYASSIPHLTDRYCANDSVACSSINIVTDCVPSPGCINPAGQNIIAGYRACETDINTGYFGSCHPQAYKCDKQPATNDAFAEVITSFLERKTTCGNDVCEVGETVSTCSQDCVKSWVKQLGTWWPEHATATALDSSGNVIVAGRYMGTPDLTGTGTGTPLSDPLYTCTSLFGTFLAKYDSLGQHLWSKAIGCDVAVQALTTDSKNNIILAGSTDSGGELFGRPSNLYYGQAIAYIAKFDPSGNKGAPGTWIAAMPGLSTYQTVTVTAVAMVPDDANDDLVIAGYFDETVNFGSYNYCSGTNGYCSSTTNNHYDAFVARLEGATGATGSRGWFRKTSTAGQYGEVASGVAVDLHGNVYLAGGFGYDASRLGSQVTYFGTQSLTGAGGFLAKYDRSGTIKPPVIDVGPGHVDDVAVDGAGDVTIVGRGLKALSPAGVVIKYDASLVERWSRGVSLSGTGTAAAQRVLAYENGDVVVSGSFTGTVNFSGTGAGRTSFGAPLIRYTDVFLAKFASGTGNLIWSKQYGGILQERILPTGNRSYYLPDTSDEYGRGLAMDGKGNLAQAGNFTGILNFEGTEVTARMNTLARGVEGNGWQGDFYVGSLKDPTASTGCSHAVTVTGTALPSSCNACAASVCAIAPACCSWSWDQSCVNLAASKCFAMPCTVGAECRSSQGACDVAEVFDLACNCPSDTFQPSTTVCRSSADSCDLQETCSGSSAACPADVKAAVGASCTVNGSSGLCTSSGACCIAETDAAFCTRLGKKCGQVTGTDNCGLTRSADCGPCGTGENCVDNLYCAAGATPDTALKVPRCVALASSCDTGSLVDSRAAIYGKAESGQPNTIAASCADGASGRYHSDESNDRLTVYTTDGLAFGAGRKVKIEARVWAYSTSNRLDLFHAADANSPSWTLITTLAPTVRGANLLSTEYTLPTGGTGTQAIRAQFRYGGSASPCYYGSYNDRDDLLFAVDVNPPSVSLSSPANGATLTGTVTLSANASDDSGVSKVEFFLGSTLVGAATSSPFSVSWNSKNLGNRSYQSVAKAFDAAGNSASSPAVTVTVSNAVFDANGQAPICSMYGSLCDSQGLVNGRAAIYGGAEPNQPNTIYDSCADGKYGSYHSDESIDRIKVSTLDGSDFAAGKTVKVEVTVWAYSSYTSDKLDLYYTATAGNPSWTYLTTLTPAGPGAQTLSATYLLPAGFYQAVRGNFRWGGSPATCDTGSYNDRDDVIFTVR